MMTFIEIRNTREEVGFGQVKSSFMDKYRVFI
jgi:hypothetical protein